MCIKLVIKKIDCIVKTVVNMTLHVEIMLIVLCTLVLCCENDLLIVTLIGVLRLVLDMAYSSIIIIVICLPAGDFSVLGTLQPNVKCVQVGCVSPGKERRA
jgi:hypothetical protein